MRWFFTFLILITVACDSSTEETPTSDSNIIVITNNQFIPQEITVAAGDTVFFHNQDETPQRILSESTEGSFDNTGLFSSNSMIQDSYGTITIPETAVSGDTLFFYSEYLTSAMSTPDGVITIE